MHATYAISPTLLNETSFNYNGNRINIVPFAGSGLSSLSIPAGYDATSSRLFSGPNNLNRIPNIDLNGSNGTHFEISSWPWHNVRRMIISSATTCRGPKGRTSSRLAEAGPCTKKSKTSSDNPGRIQFRRHVHGQRLRGLPPWRRQELQRTRRARPRPLEQRFVGRLRSDNWRVNRNLTLNLGLRWDGVPHTYEANNRMGNFYPSLYNPANAAVVLCGNDQPLQSGARPEPESDSGWRSALPERHRHAWARRCPEGPGQQSLGINRSAPRLCLRSDWQRQDGCALAASESCTNGFKATTCITPVRTFPSAST